MFLADLSDLLGLEHAGPLVGVTIIVLLSFFGVVGSYSRLFFCLNFKGHFPLVHYFVLRDSECVLGLRENLLVEVGLGLGSRLRSLLLKFSLILLHIHNHLEVVEFLSSSKIVNRVNKWLFTHCYNLLANVFDKIVL
jgi:hypothetical protein